MFQRLIQGYEDQKARIHRLFREGGWIVAGQAASVLGALVLVRVLTAYLDPAEYGQLALGLTLATLVNQVVMGGLIAGIGRFYSIATEKGDLWGYLRAARRMLLVATVVVVGLGTILIGALAVADMHHWLWLVAAILVLSIVSSYNSALNGIQNAARQRAIVALHGGMDAWLKIGLVVGVMLWLGTHSAAVAVGYALSAFIVTLSQFVFLKRLIAKQGASNAHAVNENWAGQMWLFSWPFSVWGVFTWGQQASERWALERFASTSDVGQYTVVFQLGYMPITILLGLVMTLVGPVLYQRSGDTSDLIRNASVQNIAWKVTKFSIALTILGFLAASLWHKWLFHWLVAEPFRESSFLLPWVMLAGGIFSSGQILALKMMSELRSKSLLIAKVATAVLGILANIIGACLYGMEGVIGAGLFFSVIYFCWMVFLANFPPHKQLVRNRNGSCQK